MDKKSLYGLSLEVKALINADKLDEATYKVEEAHLSQDELNFVFMCLHSNGYDPETDRFVIYHSDNSAFLKLVNIVQSKVSKGK